MSACEKALFAKYGIFLELFWGGGKSTYVQLPGGAIFCNRGWGSIATGPMHTYAYTKSMCYVLNFWIICIIKLTILYMNHQLGHILYMNWKYTIRRLQCIWIESCPLQLVVRTVQCYRAYQDEYEYWYLFIGRAILPSRLLSKINKYSIIICSVHFVYIYVKSTFVSSALWCIMAHVFLPSSKSRSVCNGTIFSLLRSFVLDS